jgi:hypothetical protein
VIEELLVETAPGVSLNPQHHPAVDACATRGLTVMKTVIHRGDDPGVRMLGEAFGLARRRFSSAGEEQAVDRVGDRGGAERGYGEDRDLPEQGPPPHLRDEACHLPQPDFGPVQKAGDGQ